MIKINLLNEFCESIAPPAVKRGIGWISWLIALLALAWGVVLWRFGEKNDLVNRLDRTFQDRLIDINQFPKRAPIPVTLVEMEDAENWDALEYSLFLKAVRPSPDRNPPIIVFESLPPAGNSAFNRAFNDLAIKQLRLVLPVMLSKGKADREGENWWLKGWNPNPSANLQSNYTSVAAGPPEVLRGTVEVGVANLPEKADLAPLYFRIGEKDIPSLALRAAMLARKISDGKVRFDLDLLLGEQRLRTTATGSLVVDTSFLPGMRRIASSDLLLNLAPETTDTGAPLQGVVVVGNLSGKAHTLPTSKGNRLAPAEWIAATIATICNGPILSPVEWPSKTIILTLSVLATFLFPKVPGIGKWFTLFALLGIYLLFSIYFVERRSLATPLALPLGVLTLAAALHHLTELIQSIANSRNARKN